MGSNEYMNCADQSLCLMSVQWQLQLITVLPELKVEEQHSERHAGEKQGIEPAMEELEL